LPHQQELNIADTGSTANFGTTIDAPVITKHPTLNPITIRNPNGVRLILALAPSSLMGQMCDAGCTMIAFTATKVTVLARSSMTPLSPPATELPTPDYGTFLCAPHLLPRHWCAIL
jgi:hypothetical protein